MTIPTVQGSPRRNPPDWAVGQRALIDTMNAAAVPFVNHATRPDGTLIQQTEWTSMDGTDNGYEAFLSFSLFYVLGGNEFIQETARKEWEAITWQYSNTGTVDREFVTGFDWFHHSESYTYLYYLAMANPEHFIDRNRARRFAAMYMGEDPLAPNWDAEKRMIRGPLNGSHGPRLVCTKADWEYHRAFLDPYLAPFEDIPGTDSSDPMFKVKWSDDEMFDKLMPMINERLVRGDVPLNMNIASMITHAFLFTGEDKYKQWVLDYLQAWVERRDANGGIMPDNIGPSGEIGELNGGNWWGGYYGWRWPHGARNIIEPAFVAGSCAVLMTGDLSHLDLCRSVLDSVWAQRKEVDGVMMVPARHGGQGWFDFRPPDSHLYNHLYYISQSDEDLARLNEVFPHGERFDDIPADGASVSPTKAWSAFIAGKNPEFPQKALESMFSSVCEALNKVEADDTDPEKRECNHFHSLNTVIPEGLVRMAMGTPAALYNGGMLQAHVRHFDPAGSAAAPGRGLRSGLPAHVAALVDKVSADGAHLTLVNTDPVASHPVLMQAGSFGEHEFTEVSVDRGDGAVEQIVVNGKYLRVELGPAAQVTLDLGIKRFAHKPSYDFPPYDG